VRGTMPVFHSGTSLRVESKSLFVSGRQQQQQQQQQLVRAALSVCVCLCSPPPHGLATLLLQAAASPPPSLVRTTPLGFSIISCWIAKPWVPATFTWCTLSDASTRPSKLASFAGSKRRPTTFENTAAGWMGDSSSQRLLS
jgi:hypothetical protein